MERPLRIIAADDDPDMLDFYRDALARLGHQATVARDGRQLVELCRALQPDLVVTDVAMPELDGVEAVLRVWRERPVPVVVVSASDPGEVRARLPSGPASFLRKPVGLADLARAVTLATSGGQNDTLPGPSGPAPPTESPPG
jgi:CheY-like chemotaxis protein